MPTSNRDRVITALQALIEEHYVIADEAPAVSAALEPLRRTAVADPSDLADLVNARLQQATHDKHLRVRHRPDGAVSELNPDEYEKRYAREAAENAGGIRQVRRITPTVALITIAPYLSPVHHASRYIDAAFGLVSGARHLVLDVRAGGGGTPETVALFCGYLLGDEPVHLQDVVEPGKPPRRFWTTPSPRRVPGDTAVYVLTSSETFSACEELAYDLQALERATVVGERTGGGAHPVRGFRLDDVLEANIPVAASVNAVTGANWEGQGVLPDVACPAPAALETVLGLLDEDSAARRAMAGTKRP